MTDLSLPVMVQQSHIEVVLSEHLAKLALISEELIACKAANKPGLGCTALWHCCWLVRFELVVLVPELHTKLDEHVCCNFETLCLSDINRQFQLVDGFASCTTCVDLLHSLVYSSLD